MRYGSYGQLYLNIVRQAFTRSCCHKYQQISSAKYRKIYSYAQLYLSNVKQAFYCCCLDNKMEQHRAVFYYHFVSTCGQRNTYQYSRKPWTLVAFPTTWHPLVCNQWQAVCCFFSRYFMWWVYCHMGVSFIRDANNMRLPFKIVLGLTSLMTLRLTRFTWCPYFETFHMLSVWFLLSIYSVTKIINSIYAPPLRQITLCLSV